MTQESTQDTEKCYQYNCDNHAWYYCCLCTNTACEKHSNRVTKYHDGLYVCDYCYDICQKAYENKQQVEHTGE